MEFSILLGFFFLVILLDRVGLNMQCTIDFLLLVVTKGR